MTGNNSSGGGGAMKPNGQPATGNDNDLKTVFRISRPGRELFGTGRKGLLSVVRCYQHLVFFAFAFAAVLRIQVPLVFEDVHRRYGSDHSTEAEESVVTTAVAGGRGVQDSSNNKGKDIVVDDIVEYPRLLSGNVLLMDVIWLPLESKVEFIATQPKYFRADQFGVVPSPREHNIDFSTTQRLVSPLSLAESSWLLLSNDLGGGGTAATSVATNLTSCVEQPTLSNDVNIDQTLFLVQCKYDDFSLSSNAATAAALVVPSTHKQGRRDRAELIIARFGNRRLNAAGSMKFRRPLPSPQERRNSFSVSVAIKPVVDFTHDVLDILEYYRRQGVSHVYLGVSSNKTNVLHKYERALFIDGNFSRDFVSIGAIITVLQYLNKEKMPFMQSALYHSKSFDNMLVVMDLDEIIVTASPTNQSVVDVLRKLDGRNETCYYTLESNAVLRPDGIKYNLTTPLAERMPHRCHKGGKHQPAYEKSVAVLNNCDYVGLHYHGACREGTKAAMVDRGMATHLHFANLWKPRYQNEHDIATCTVTNEFTRFMRSGLDWSSSSSSNNNNNN